MGTLILPVAIAAFVVWFAVEKGRRKSHVMPGGKHENITLPHEAEFELYSNALSHCSRKARLVFAELGIAYTHKPIDLIETGWYETISPAYLKVNPGGQVPTLVHDGHPIYESDDIMNYAAQMAGPDAPKLVPQDEAAKAEMERWVHYGAILGEDLEEQMETSAGSCVPFLTFPLFATTIRYIPAHRILTGLLFHRDKRRPVMFLALKLLGVKRLDKIGLLYNMMRRARAAMPQHLAKLEAQLKASGGPWILGDSYTLADVSWTALLLRVDETGFLDHFVAKEGLSEVAAYYERLKARQSWATAIDGVPHEILAKGAADLKSELAADPAFRTMLLGA